MIPRFEGPQSNKDVKTYRQAAGELANPLLPSERRKAAGLVLLELIKRRKGQFTTQAILDSGGSPSPTKNPVADLQAQNEEKRFQEWLKQREGN